MTEDITAPDGSPAAPPDNLLPTDAHGDPVLQGTKMIERDSYDRVIFGLRIAAEAAAHLVVIEDESANQWRLMSQNLDQARRICVQYAGLGLVIKEKPTNVLHGGRHMGWRQARDRFREGLIQASGGCRQLATCHRGDLWFSQMATSLEELERKIRNPLVMPAQLRRLITVN